MGETEKLTVKIPARVKPGAKIKLNVMGILEDN